jgi:hypothetical protein
MSYIKIEIGGKERGLKFNQYAVITMAKFADLENYEATAAYAMTYAGLKANCYVKREEADFTFEEVCDWVDKVSAEVMLQVYNVFSETQVYKELIEKGTATEEVTKKKSSRTGSKV